MLLLFLIHVACSQLYDIGEYNTSIINPVNNHTIDLIIHYPITNQNPDTNSHITLSNHNNSITTRTNLSNTLTTTFPVIIFSHGWTCQNTWYNYIWENLVPQGYIVAMPNDDNTIIPDEFVVNYAAGQLATLDWLIDIANNDNGISNPLYQIVNPYLSGCSGHSMGGGACMLSMSDNYIDTHNKNNYQFNHTFNSGFLLSGCNWNPSSRFASYNISTPIFFLTGNGDCMCEPSKYAEKYYSHVPETTCKYLANINNGTHCNFEEAGIYLGECDALQRELCIQGNYTIVNSIGIRQQWEITNKYMTQFFNASLMYNNTNSIVYEKINQILKSDFENNVMCDIEISC